LLCAAIAAVLLTRPWWGLGHRAALLAQDAACAAAILPALALAAIAWRGGPPIRLAAACALLIPVAALPLIALPAFAALRRLSPAVLDEARVAGAGWPAIVLSVVLPQAAPGLAFGAALALAPAGDWRLVAAALPLLFG
jgi:ABC-type nitrate/sulfonate/bicarbonate transport system permease component